MAIGHIAVRTHKRSAGHSAAAVLAYRHGTALVCPRTGEIHDYTRRSGVARCGTVASVDTPLTQSLDALVAGIEGAERRRDSRISRDVQVALPCELSEPQNHGLTQAFAKALAERYHTLASWAIHRPHRNDDGDPRNVHAHIVIPTRALDETGQLGRKLVELDHPKQSRDEVKAIRLLWEETANAALIEAGVSARVDVGRREDGDPAPTLGPTHAAIERKARRRRGHRTTGVPVAELVTDGQSVTGRGRRLEKHERRRRRRRVREQDTATRPTLDEGRDGEVVLESLRAIPEDDRAPPPAVRPGQDFGATRAARAVPEPELVPPPAVRPGQDFGATTAVRAVPEPEAVPPPAVRPGQDFGATRAARAVPEPELVPPPAVRPGQVFGATRAARAVPEPEAVPPPAVRPGQDFGATRAVRAVPEPELVPPPAVRPGQDFGATRAARAVPEPELVPPPAVRPGQDFGATRAARAVPEPEAVPPPAVRPGQDFGATRAARAVPEPELVPPPAVRPGQDFGATTAARAVPEPEAVPPPAVRPGQDFGATRAVRAVPEPELVPPPAVRPGQDFGATRAARAVPEPELVPPPAVRPGQDFGATRAARAVPEPEAVPPPAVRPGQDFGATRAARAVPEPELVPPPAVRPGQDFGATTAARAVPEPELVPPPAVRPGQVFGATRAARAVPEPEAVPPPAVRPGQDFGATRAVRAVPEPELVPPPAVRPGQVFGATRAARAVPEPEAVPPPAVRPGQVFGATTAARAVPEDERAPSPPVFTLTRRGHSGTLRGLHTLHQTLNRLREQATSLGQKAARAPAQTEVRSTPEETQKAREYLKGSSYHERPSLRTVIERIAQARLDGTEAEAPQTDEWRRQWRIRRVIEPHTKERPQAERPYELDTYNRGAVRSPKSAEVVARELDSALIRTCKEHYGPASPLGPPPAEHFHAFTAAGRKRKRMRAIDNALRAWRNGFNQFMEDLTHIVIHHEVRIRRDRGREKRRDDELHQQRVQQGRHRSKTRQRRKRDGFGIGD